MRAILKKVYLRYNVKELRTNPILWFYGAYLTIRYVDHWTIFPAIKFKDLITLRIFKHKTSQLVIKNRLIIDPFLNYKDKSVITLEQNAKIEIGNEFTIGDNVRIFVSSNAKLLLKGKSDESASGITANAVLMVENYLEIGCDCIIAWETFLTDSDWHPIEGKEIAYDTIIKDHVWIGVGVKILKGVTVGENSIVTSNSVLLGGQYPKSTLISGNPAKVVKSNIPLWHR